MRIILILAMLVLTAAACGARCDFTGSRCDGNVVQECGGSDAIFSHALVEHACVAPAELCQTVSSTEAVCVQSPATQCDPASFNAHCQGTLRIFCKSGWVTADDCATAAGAGQCVVNTNVVVCQ